MPLIIDTYNVLHVVGVLPPEIAGLDVGGLVALIARSRYRRRRAMLVCDGVPGEDAPTGPTGPIEVRYSGHGRTADDLIARLVGVSTAPRRLTVVSDDRGVLAAARRRRCETLGSRDFLRQLAADHQAQPPAASPAPAGRSGSRLPLDEVEAWVRRFNVTDADLAPPEPPAPAPVEPDPDPAPAAPPPTTPIAATPGEPEPTAPATPVLPTALVLQAMEMAAAAEAEAARDEAVKAEEAERDADGEEARDEAAAGQTDPSRGYAAVLPGDLVAEAEAIAAAAADDRRPDPADAPKEGTKPGPDEGPAPFAGAPAPSPPDPVFGRGILEEAEALCLDDGDADPDGGEPRPAGSDEPDANRGE